MVLTRLDTVRRKRPEIEQLVIANARQLGEDEEADDCGSCYSVTSARASGLLSGSRTQCCDTVAW